MVLAIGMGFAMCASRANPLVPPGVATLAQIQEALSEIQEMMEAAERTDTQIHAVVQDFRCVYLPETVEDGYECPERR